MSIVRFSGDRGRDPTSGKSPLSARDYSAGAAGKIMKNQAYFTK